MIKSISTFITRLTTHMKLSLHKRIKQKWQNAIAEDKVYLLYTSERIAVYKVLDKKLEDWTKDEVDYLIDMLTELGKRHISAGFGKTR